MGYINKKNKVGGVSESSPLLLEGELGIDLNAANGDVGRVWVGTGAANIALGKRTEIEAKVTSNTAITGATKTKITYDAKGLVTSGTDVTATDVVNTPAGNIVATTVQEAINELDSEKANIASPVFTGNVTGLGVATGTSFNSITALASVPPLAPDVTAAVGTSTTVARQDHVHPVDTSRAPLAPNYTGIMADITAAGTTNIGAATADYLNITGTTTITAFDTVAAGIERTLKFANALTLTHNATSLILPTDANIMTVAGDTAIFRSEGSGNWRLVGGTIYTRIVGPSASPSISGVTAYHLLEGNLALASATITAGFGTTLYTGNGSTQSINTDIDMTTQWGSDATESYGGLIWLKSRSNVLNNFLIDTNRGVSKYIISNSTSVEGTDASMVTSFNTNGFNLGASYNTNLYTYASWAFQTTHRITGTTNHGKAYTCHYNPYTGFTIVKYEGSGIAGHEIPHFLSQVPAFATFKNLTTAIDWVVGSQPTGLNNLLKLNTTDASTATTTMWSAYPDNQKLYLGTDTGVNTSTNQYIMYGWANSYFDEANTLIGNYEIGIYQGTGATGNKVTTRGKPAWVMIKRLDSIGNWGLFDNIRTNDGYLLYADVPAAEVTSVDILDIAANGFTLKVDGTYPAWNASGGQYLYMVAYDNDSGSGKSKYPKPSDNPTLNLTAKIPFANGVDANGTKVSILSKNETVSGVTLTQGKNYIWSDNTGTYGKSVVAPTYSNVNPANGGDFFDLTKNKWFTSAGAEITNSRNYLDAVVYADSTGNVTYVEQLPKTQYFDEIKANEFKGKNACTAWVNFDGTTTPPTIRDSFNVSSVVRTSTGVFDIYFKELMDNANYSLTSSTSYVNSVGQPSAGINNLIAPTINKCSVRCLYGGNPYNTNFLCLSFTGGKN